MSGLLLIALLLAGFTGILNNRARPPEPACPPSGALSTGAPPAASRFPSGGGGGDLLDRVRAAGPDFERRVTALAKEAVEHFVRTGAVIETGAVAGTAGYRVSRTRAGQAAAGQGATREAVDRLLAERAGVFVTIISDNRVRGCIGSIYPQQDSMEAEIIHNAIMAASADMRHPPVREDELDKLSYSVAIVGRVERVDPGMEFDPGEFGVLVTPVPGGGGRTGVILPGEARTWSKAVSWAMQEAGISPGEGFELQRFQAASFGKKLELYR